MRVEEFLRDSAARFPDKTALVAGEPRLTYSRARRRSPTGSPRRCVERGVERGDRVVVFMDNCVEAVVAIFAVAQGRRRLQSGQPVDQGRQARLHPQQLPARGADHPAQARRRRRRCARRGAVGRSSPSSPAAGAPALAGAVHWREALAAPTSRCRRRRHRHRPRDAHLHLGLDRLPQGRDDDASRTSSPRPTSITTYLENTADDIILNVLPISFDYGLYQVLMAMKLGATLVLEKSFAFPQAIFERMRAERVTGLPLVPTMAALILQMRDLQPGAFPAPALHHQHRRGAAAGAHRAAARAVSRRARSIRCTA